MKVFFSGDCKRDLLEASSRYATISTKLGDDFHDRVREAVRTVISWGGGGHVGPHGFPCRRCHPFPYILYYEIEAGTLYILGLVHARRHPSFLRRRLADESE